ncbi:uncharacterized protein LOC127841046 [Dreissena polymorpha]|nr:uncharacterized protein LOC127841046 [Dreissena polymorpha]
MYLFKMYVFVVCNFFAGHVLGTITDERQQLGHIQKFIANGGLKDPADSVLQKSQGKHVTGMNAPDRHISTLGDIPNEQRNENNSITSASGLVRLPSVEFKPKNDNLTSLHLEEDMDVQNTHSVSDFMSTTKISVSDISSIPISKHTTPASHLALSEKEQNEQRKRSTSINLMKDSSTFGSISNTNETSDSTHHLADYTRKQTALNLSESDSLALRPETTVTIVTVPSTFTKNDVKLNEIKFNSAQTNVTEFNSNDVSTYKAPLKYSSTFIKDIEKHQEFDKSFTTTRQGMAHLSTKPTVSATFVKDDYIAEHNRLTITSASTTLKLFYRTLTTTYDLEKTKKVNPLSFTMSHIHSQGKHTGTQANNFLSHTRIKQSTNRVETAQRKTDIMLLGTALDEKTNDPCSCSRLSDGLYTQSAIVGSIIGGVLIGMTFMLGVTYLRNKCRRHLYGDYRRVPMEYDFELNPRFKPH